MHLVGLVDRHVSPFQSQFWTLVARLDAIACLRLVRLAAVAVSVLLSTVAVSLLLSAFTDGPRAVELAVAAFVVATGVAATVIFGSRRWPSQRLSAAFAVAAIAAVVSWPLALPDPATGVIVIIACAPLGAYIEAFHPRLAVPYVIAVAVTSAVLLDQLSDVGSPRIADLTAGLVVVVGGALLAAHVVVAALDLRTIDSEIDPMTGAYNRFGFETAGAAIVASRARASDGFLAVVTVTVRPSPGDAVPDQRALARAVSATTRHGAVVGCLSPDTFAVLDVFDCSDAAPLAQRLRDAITSPPHRLAVRIGAATCPLDGLYGQPPDLVIDELLDRAALASAAGLAGGDGFGHASCRRIQSTVRGGG